MAYSWHQESGSPPPKALFSKLSSGVITVKTLWKQDGAAKTLGARLAKKITQRRPSRARVHASVNFGDLPHDILIEILYQMELPEALAMNQVCRALYDAIQSVFHRFKSDLQAEGVCLVVGDSVDPATLSETELKRVVLRSHRLHSNWDKKPRGQNPRDTRLMELHFPHKVMPLLSMAPTYSCDNCFVLMTDYKLVCVDVERPALMGEYYMDYNRPHVSFAKSHKKDALYVIIIGNNSKSSVMELCVIHVRIWDESASPFADFECGIEHTIPDEVSVVATTANAEEKTLCLLVHENRPNKNLKILVVLDWDVFSYCALDSGLYIKKPGDRAANLIRYSGDYQTIVMYAERDGQWIQESFKVSCLKANAHSSIKDALAHPIPLRSLSTSPYGDIKYTHTSTTFYLPSQLLRHSQKLMSWTFPHPHYRRRGTPSKYSHISIYGISQAGLTSNHMQYWVSQHFASDEGPYEGARVVLPLKNPRTVHNEANLAVPLMDVSYNNMIWIEDVDMESNGMGARFQLRFFTFQNAMTQGETPDVKTLEKFPPIILKYAHHIFIRPNMAAITIITTENKLYTYYYA